MAGNGEEFEVGEPVTVEFGVWSGKIFTILELPPVSEGKYLAVEAGGSGSMLVSPGEKSYLLLVPGIGKVLFSKRLLRKINTT